jgi:hypothetical protein
MATSNSGVWHRFKSVLVVPETGVPWYQIFLGDGDRQKIQHGTLPCDGGPIYPTEDTIEFVEKGIRGLHCRYSVSENWREIRFEISGEIREDAIGSLQGDKGSEKVLMFAFGFAENVAGILFERYMERLDFQQGNTLVERDG